VEEQVYFREDRSLDISLSRLINSHKVGGGDEQNRRTPRGQSGLTSYGKNMVENACYRLEQKYSSSRLGFLTLTLPGLREDLLILLAHDWSEVVRQFFQELQRSLSKKNPQIADQFVGVTEIQPNRLAKTGIPALHLHILYVAHGGDFDWYVTADQLRAIWRRVLIARLRHYLPDEDIEIDTRAAVNCQKLKKSAGAELSKYLSKGSCLSSVKESGYGDCIPSSWWHSSLRLKREVKSYVIETPLDLKLCAFRGIDLVDRGLAVYLWPVDRDGIIFGWTGKLNDTGQKFFRNTE
jgi:hypothetical protein